MGTIQIHDPAPCCSTGVCFVDVDVDEALIHVAADLERAKQQGAAMERYKLVPQPFAAHHAANPLESPVP